MEQIRSDFPADPVDVRDYYIYIGDRLRSFINVDPEEIINTRADSNRGRNYVLFLAMFLYTRFQLLPAPGSLSHQLVTEIEMAKVRSFHARLQRFGHGLGYYEYWDGSRWRVKAVPFSDPDQRPPVALPAPPGQEASSDDSQEAWEPLEELEQVPEELSGPEDGVPERSAGER